MKKVSVIGLGLWGTALAQHLSANGITITGWDRNDSITKEINSKKNHPKFFKEHKLDFKATSDFAVATLESDLIMLVTATKALPEIIERLKVLNTVSPILSCMKGFCGNDADTPLQFLRKNKFNSNQLAVLAGPSFAIDVINKKPVGLVIASENITLSEQITKIFSSKTLRPYTSTDPIGVELGGAIKNVIAIAAGISDALEFGESARASIITRGLAEILRLGIFLGAKKETFFGLSGLGDLQMTCSSTTSRNHTVGYRLGKGEAIDEIISSLGSVAEGVTAARYVCKIATENNIEMPISQQVLSILNGEISPKDATIQLMSRPIKCE